MDLLVNGDIEIRAVTNRNDLSRVDLSMGHVVVALDVIHVYGFFDYRRKVSKNTVSLRKHFKLTTRLLINAASPFQNVGIIVFNAANIALEMTKVNGIKSACIL